MSVSSTITVKRLAADILKVGENRIRIKPEELGRAMDALTREDVRGLIEDGAVYALPCAGPRTKPQKAKKRRGRRRGTKHSRKGSKESWMEKVRSQRKYVAALVASGELPLKFKRQIYLKVKGGAFKGKNALRTYLAENGMLKEGAAAALPARAKPKNKAKQAVRHGKAAQPGESGAARPPNEAEGG